MHFEKKNLHNENYENSYTLDGRKLHKLLPRTRKVSHHDNETLDRYVELCANKKEKSCNQEIETLLFRLKVLGCISLKVRRENAKWLHPTYTTIDCTVTVELTTLVDVSTESTWDDYCRCVSLRYNWLDFGGRFWQLWTKCNIFSWYTSEMFCC